MKFIYLFAESISAYMEDEHDITPMKMWLVQPPLHLLLE